MDNTMSRQCPGEKSRDCPILLKFGHFPFGIVFPPCPFFPCAFHPFSVHCPPTATTWVWGGLKSQPLLGERGQTAPGPSLGCGQVQLTMGDCPSPGVRSHPQPAMAHSSEQAAGTESLFDPGAVMLFSAQGRHVT